MQPVDEPLGEFLLYQTEEAKTWIRVRLEGRELWLTQQQLADLFRLPSPSKRLSAPVSGHCGSRIKILKRVAHFIKQGMAL